MLISSPLEVRPFLVISSADGSSALPLPHTGILEDRGDSSARVGGCIAAHCLTLVTDEYIVTRVVGGIGA